MIIIVIHFLSSLQMQMMPSRDKNTYLVGGEDSLRHILIIYLFQCQTKITWRKIWES